MPHQGGKQSIMYWISDEQENWRETPAWAVKRLKKTYERLSSDHPRIVRYAWLYPPECNEALLCSSYNNIRTGAIGGAYGEKIGGLLLEELTPGSMYVMD